MGRDHSIECEKCGTWYGGFNGPNECECNQAFRCTCYAEEYDTTGIECLVCRLAGLRTLAHNLATVAALEFAFWLGTDWAEWANDPHPDPAPFHPGRRRPAPGWEGK